jgi:flavin reductase (DIM6/NTAB) family NADH-FMN oxidoreductase RutF
MTTPADDSTAHDRIGALLGRVASGVFVLAVGDGQGRETGMLASWVQQAAFNPPMLSIAINRERWFTPWLAESPRVALSIVGSSQKQHLKHFGKGFGPEEPAFEGLAITRGATGLPLITDSLGSLEGRIVSQTPAGDHVLLLVEIDSATTGTATDEHPMVHIRKNGFRY